MSKISLDSVLTNVVPQVFRALGGELESEVTLIRRSQVSAAGITLSALVAATPAAGGDTSLKLTTNAGRLSGKIVAGTRLLVSAETVTVTHDSVVDAGGNVEVSFQPALLSPAATGDTVQVDAAEFTFYDCYIEYERATEGSFKSRAIELDNFIDKNLTLVSLPVKNAPTIPMMQDWLRLTDGTVGKITKQPERSIGCWDCVLIF